MKPVKPTKRQGYTRLSAKRQVTLPLRVIEAMGLHVGDELKVEADGERIVLFREPDRRRQRLDAIQRVSGRMPGVWKEGDLERLRNEWR